MNKQAVQEAAKWLEERTESKRFFADEVAELLASYRGGWVAVEERLPKLEVGSLPQDVLVTDGRGVSTGYHHPLADDDGWSTDLDGDVLAWQPLPEPFYQEDNDAE